MSKRVRWMVWAILLLVVAGIVLYPLLKKKRQADTPSAAAPQREKTLVVNAEVVKPQSITDKTITNGDILPAEEVDLSFETSGKVVAIYFKEGEYVKKGTVLAKINDAPLQAQLKKLQAQEQLANDRVFRQQTLLERDAVSQETYESVLTDYNKLQADIDLVKAQIAQTELRAPFDGVIGLRLLSEGAYASPNTKIASMAQTTQVKIDFSIPETYSSQVRRGTPIRFMLMDDQGRQKWYDAQVYAVEPIVDKETRTLQVRALYSNTTGELIPGRFISVEITRQEISDALSVPSESIIPEMGKYIVYVYRQGKAHAVTMEAGLRTESRVQVLSGLSEGDTLLTTGVMQLREGMQVTIDKMQ